MDSRPSDLTALCSVLIGGEKLTLALCVDDGVRATTLNARYQQFLADVGQKFKPSDSTCLEWYQGIDVNHDIEVGVTTLTHKV